MKATTSCSAAALGLLLWTSVTAAAIVDVGTGRDGDLLVSSLVDPNFRSAVSGTASGSTLAVTSTAGLLPGDEVMVHTTWGGAAGQYEFARIDSITGNTLTLRSPLQRTYGGSDWAQVIRVPHFQDVTVTSSGRLNATGWNGSTGGVLAMRVRGQISVTSGGRIDADGAGFAGGAGGGWHGSAGAGYNASGDGAGKQGLYNAHSTPRSNNPDSGDGGGGAGHRNAGTRGVWRNNGSATNSHAGGAYGTASLSVIHLGSGGGGGSGDYGQSRTYWTDSAPGGRGGNGGGIVFLAAQELDLNGVISSNGANGANHGGAHAGGGGGGAGGSIFIQAFSLTSSTPSPITVNGGNGGTGGSPGGAGGAASVGRVRVDFASNQGLSPSFYQHSVLLTGSTIPEPATLAGLVLLAGGLLYRSPRARR